MTREEAIKHIITYAYYEDDIPFQVATALDMAISALRAQQEQEHTVAKDILLEVYDRFGVTMAIEKFVARGYMEWDKDKKDEYGFPAVNVIVPPDQWDINEEA